MPTAAEFEREKSEVEAVLASGIFARAPNLADVLTYVCAKYFEGQAGEIKEYNIAVEALKRPPHFDQKRDSIVRVAAHRLRKRLDDYYAGEGASHAIRIVVPPGQYAPRFVTQEPEIGAVALPPENAAIVPASPPIEFRIVRPNRRRELVLLAIAIVAVTVLAVWSIVQLRRKTTVVSSNDVPATLPTAGDVRILAGLETGSYMDGFGRVWQSDRYFHGGSTFHLANHPVSGTRDPRVYQNRREGSFTYDIPLKPGIYELRLHFAETLYGDGNSAGGGEATRIFNIVLNGKPALNDFDVIGEAGSNAADIKVFKNISPASDGKLHIGFGYVDSVPFLNAIEITPGIPDRMRPIRMIARDRAYNDRDGRYWEPDRYARGGQLVVRPDVVMASGDPELHRGERFGNLTYIIPVARGRYAATLWFAETWFGPNKAGGGGAGSRLFHILCNGVALARNFDIYAAAGGADRECIRTFHGLEPNPQGKIVL